MAKLDQKILEKKNFEDGVFSTINLLETFFQILSKKTYSSGRIIHEKNFLVRSVLKKRAAEIRSFLQNRDTEIVMKSKIREKAARLKTTK